MKGLAGAPPVVTTTEQVDPLPLLKRTLREHYARKRGHYGVARSSSYDPDLKRLFSDDSVHGDKMSAAAFLKRFRREVRRKVASWTGEYQYTIDQVLEDMLLGRIVPGVLFDGSNMLTAMPVVHIVGGSAGDHTPNDPARHIASQVG